MAWQNEIRAVPSLVGAPARCGAPPWQPAFIPGVRPAPADDASAAERRVAAAVHLAFAFGFLSIPAAVALGSRRRFLRGHAAAAANFHLAFAGLWLATLVGFLVLLVGLDQFDRTIPALAIVPVMAGVFTAGLATAALGARRALQGRTFRYPVRLPVFGR
jgi:hypothetical protein